MFVIIIGMFLLQNAMAAAPMHCSPNPPDGTKYVNIPSMKYPNPIPKPCYPIMRKDGTPMELGALVFNKDHFEEDATLLKNINDQKAAPDLAIAARKARIKELQQKETLTNAEIQEGLKLLLSK